MADLNTDVRYIKGIGEQRAKALGKLGIATLRDLISYFPRAYDDRSALRRIADLVPGETAGVAAMVASPPTISHIRKGLDLVKLRAVDDTGTLDVTFFNQAWLKNSLHQGETYIFYGRAEGSLLRHQMANPVVEPEGRREVTGRIVPIYPPYRRSQPADFVPVHPPGAGRLRGHPAGRAAGPCAAASSALPHRVRL